MLYKFLNIKAEREIEKLRPEAKRWLSKDVDKPNNEVTLERLEVNSNYIRLIEYFKSDQKRRYMINSNYLNYLKALIYLYSSSSMSVAAGIYSPPPNVLYVINSTQKTFVELIDRFNLNN